MNENLNIIAIRKQDCQKAYKAFEELMFKTEVFLNGDAHIKSDFFKKLSVSELEQLSVDTIRKACKDTPFNPQEVKLISGQKFPDIIAGTFYGVEVKSTKSNHWISTGSSIVESTRDVNVEDIFMLFGKMGGTVPEFRCRPYEDVLYDIAVTHSPRYLINMEIDKNETIFKKMGITYNEFRKSAEAINIVRKYYREKAKANNRKEMPWWITSDNMESARSFNIRLWKSLSNEERKSLKAKCMILFPEALSPYKSLTKYNQTTLWLCSYQQVINPNVRDMYSAGGKITHVDGKPLLNPIPQVFNQIVEYSGYIKNLLENPTDELLLLIEDYNPSLLNGGNLYDNWLDICFEYAEDNKEQLKKWVEVKPTFSFSKS